MAERYPADQLYVLQKAYEDEASWTTHFELAGPQPRQTVLSTIHTAVGAMRYNPAIPLEEVNANGLSGVLVGPDNDAETVTDVIFAQDPSRRYGIRVQGEVDAFVVRLAKLEGWTEYEDAGPDMHEPLLDGMMRTIMGRNKDRYGGTAAFSLEETQGMLAPDTQLTLSGGYLFSTRPMEKPYGEPAAVVEAPHDYWNPDQKASVIREMSRLAWDLAQQDRWVLETDEGTEVYKINKPAAAQ